MYNTEERAEQYLSVCPGRKVGPTFLVPNPRPSVQWVPCATHREGPF